MNELVFDLRNYNNISELMNDVSRTMETLVKNEYECSFNYEDCDYYVLRYSDVDHNLGSDVLVWLTSDEYDKYQCGALKNHEEDEDDDF